LGDYSEGGRTGFLSPNRIFLAILLAKRASNNMDTEILFSFIFVTFYYIIKYAFEVILRKIGVLEKSVYAIWVSANKFAIVSAV
jgi:hypothetical protein